MLIRAEAADLRQASNDALCRARDARAAGKANRQVELEPTTGLEPVTCRLRIDPALRKLLCNGTRFGAFRGVFGHLGSHLYSSCTTEKRTIEEPIWRRHVARRTGRRHLAAGFCDLYLRRLSAVRMMSGEHDNFGPVGLISTLRCSRVVRAMQPAAPDLILRSVIRRVG